MGGEAEIIRNQLKFIERRVDVIEKDNKELSKLSTLMELQMEMNKEQDKFLREQSITLVKMNENLTNLNQVTQKLDNRIGTIETQFAESTVQGLQRDLKNEKESSVHIPKLVRNIFITLITTAIIAGVTYIYSNM